MARAELSLGFYQNPVRSEHISESTHPLRNLLLPLLNFRIAEGRETREAILLVVMNHIFGDLFNGRKSPWEGNKEGQVGCLSATLQGRCLVS